MDWQGMDADNVHMATLTPLPIPDCRMLTFSNNVEPANGFLVRYLRRKLVESDSDINANKEELLRVLDWVPKLWYHLHTFLEKHSTSDFLIGTGVQLPPWGQKVASLSYFATQWDVPISFWSLQHVKEWQTSWLQTQDCLITYQAPLTVSTMFWVNHFNHQKANPAPSLFSQLMGNRKCLGGNWKTSSHSLTSLPPCEEALLMRPPARRPLPLVLTAISGQPDSKFPFLLWLPDPSAWY